MERDDLREFLVVPADATDHERSTPMEHDDLQAFLLVLRRALLMIVRYIEQRYHLTTE